MDESTSNQVSEYSSNKYLLTQVSNIESIVNTHDAKIDALKIDQGVLKDALSNEIGSAKDLIDLNSSAITKESVERINGELAIDGRISDLSATHIEDKAYLIGEIERHHAEQQDSIGTLTTELELERDTREASIDSVINQLSNAQQSMESRVETAMQKYDALDDAFDFTTADSDITVDTDQELTWSILSEAHSWELELGDAVTKMEQQVLDKIREMEATVIQVSEDASTALENTDLGKLVEKLQGQIGIDALDNVLWGKIDGLASDLKAQAVETIHRENELYLSLVDQILDTATKRSDDLLAKIEQLTDGLSSQTARSAEHIEVEAQQRADDIASEARARVKAIEDGAIFQAEALEQKAQELVAKITESANSSLQALKDKSSELSADYTQRIEQLRSDYVTANGVLSDAIADGITQSQKVAEDAIKKLDTYKVSNDDAIAGMQKQLSVLVTDTSSIATDVSSLASRVGKNDADIVSLTQTVADEQSSTASKIDALTASNESNQASIADAQEAISDLDSATSTKFSELDATLKTTNDSLNKTSSAVAKAQQDASSAVSANSALSKRMDTLSAQLTDLGEGADTVVDVTAFNALAAEVRSQGDELTTVTTDTTELKSGLATVVSDLSGLETEIDSNTQAVKTMQTAQTTQGSDIAQSITDIAKLKSDLAVTNKDVASKATTSTVKALDTKVTSIDGRVSTNTSDLASIANRVTTTEGAITKKADSTALDETNTLITDIGGVVESHTTKLSLIESNLATTDANTNTAIENAAKAQTTADTAVADGQSNATKISSVESSLSKYKTSNDKALATANTKITSVETASNTADTALGDRIDNLTTTVTNNNVAVSGQIKSVEDSVTTLEGNTTTKVSKLESSLTEAQAGIAQANTDIATTNTNLATTNKNLATTNTNLGTTNKNVTANTKSIAATNTEVSRINGEVVSQGSSIVDIKSSVDGVTKTTNEYRETIESIAKETGATNTKLERMISDMSANFAGDEKGNAGDNSTQAGYESFLTTISDHDTARAERVEKLFADFDGLETSLASSIKEVNQSIANATTASNNKITALESTVKSKIDDVVNPLSAKLTSEYYTKADIDNTVIAGKLEAYTSTVNQKISDAVANIDADSAIQVVIPDTRNTNEDPQWYRENYAQSVVTEFKSATVLGLTTTLAGSNYVTLVTYVGWRDSSGGSIKQVVNGATEDLTYVRFSTGAKTAETWGTWVKVGSTQTEALSVTLQEQTDVINGVRGIKTITIDNNGVLAGYGLVSDIVNGKVTSAFGVNADQFYVGNPSSGKKVFSVSGSTTIINDAIIGNLSANKITTGTLSADRIKAGSLSADKLSASAIETIALAAQTVTVYKDTAKPNGTRSVQTGGLTQYYDDNNVMRIRIGFWD